MFHDPGYRVAVKRHAVTGWKKTKTLCATASIQSEHARSSYLGLPGLWFGFHNEKLICRSNVGFRDAATLVQ